MITSKIPDFWRSAALLLALAAAPAAPAAVNEDPATIPGLPQATVERDHEFLDQIEHPAGQTIAAASEPKRDASSVAQVMPPPIAAKAPSTESPNRQIETPVSRVVEKRAPAVARRVEPAPVPAREVAPQPAVVEAAPLYAPAPRVRPSRTFMASTADAPEEQYVPAPSFSSRSGVTTYRTRSVTSDGRTVIYQSAPMVYPENQGIEVRRPEYFEERPRHRFFHRLFHHDD